MDSSNIIECGGFYFIHNFDSGNLGHVERVPTELIAPSINHKTNAAESPSYEFNLWTRPDCAGTEFENGNRTWFYFGVQAPEANTVVRLNLINLNKQGKMYNQGMAPVTRTLPGKPQWERIRDRPIHSTDDNTFTLSFKYRTSENLKATTFFAFTYPFSFAELQIALNSIDHRMLPLAPAQCPDDIYYHRECLIYSLEGRRVDLLTITSHHGITNEREDRLKNLFPDNYPRPFKFRNKKIIFMSARVHPGETPSSFVFNGFLNLLLAKSDPIAAQLRKLYVFKMIPFLNPDGVARGHYRTDTRGVNLNRVYLNPSLAHHPTVYASRSLIRYYHFGCEREDSLDDTKSFMSRSVQNITESVEFVEQKKKKPLSISLRSSEVSGKREDKKSMVSKPVAAKSSSSVKMLTPDSTKKNSVTTNEASTLAIQVCDMRLQEGKPGGGMRSLPADSGSLLHEDALQSCLGSSVHLSTSEELNIQGQNPLRPLRDALKNSISLLMESSSSVVGDSSRVEVKDPRMSTLKMGWCKECRQAVDKLEDSMPGITYMVPGYSSTMNDDDTVKEEKREMVYFCTNCFKRYTLTESNDELNVSLVTNSASRGVVGSLSAVSGGDSGDARPAVAPVPAAHALTAAPVASAPEPVSAPAPAPVPLAAVPVPSFDITIDEDHRVIRKKEEPPKTVVKVIKKKAFPTGQCAPAPREPDSGLYLYIDLHGHASKKGIFMYGNHFEDLDSSVECMLLPRIMSLNNLHFHFSSCNFTERNMYLKDRRDGMSREGSGRVAVLKATGLVRSYTLECNYNTGRLVNVLPPPARAPAASGAPSGPGAAAAPPPPKYTPHIYEEVKLSRQKQSLEVFKDIDPTKVGRSLGASILDLTGQHPNSRIPCSEHRNLAAVREWLRAHTRGMRPPQLAASRLRPKTSSPTRTPLYARSKGKMADAERKENAPAPLATLAPLAPLAPPARLPAGVGGSALTKRRNVLAIRKPNAGGKARTASRGARGKAAASSSSEDATGGRSWEEVGTVLGAQGGGVSRSESLALTGKRRPFPNPSPARLKKIRLKTAI